MKWFEKKKTTSEIQKPWFEKISARTSQDYDESSSPAPQNNKFKNNEFREYQTMVGQTAVAEKEASKPYLPLEKVFFKFIEKDFNPGRENKSLQQALKEEGTFEKNLNLDDVNFSIGNRSEENIPAKDSSENFTFFKINSIEIAQKPKKTLQDLFELPPMVGLEKHLSPYEERKQEGASYQGSYPPHPPSQRDNPVFVSPVENKGSYDLSSSTAYLEVKPIAPHETILKEETIPLKPMAKPENSWLEVVSHDLHFVPLSSHTSFLELPDLTTEIFDESEVAEVNDTLENTLQDPSSIDLEEEVPTTDDENQQAPKEFAGGNITGNSLATNEVFSSEKLRNILKPLPVFSQSVGKMSSKDDDESASVTPLIQLSKPYQVNVNSLKIQNDNANLISPEETQNTIGKLETTLKTFGIEGRVVGMQKGPIITRFEIKMAPGIKVAKISGLTDEIAMALEAIRVRIEAPIPGRSTVGIEIPNKKRAQVLLGDIINDSVYKEYEGQLPLPMGKDIAGNIVLEDLCKMPHLLIAGATGSGKSVSVNSFIISLILRKSPEQLRLILIDPKLVELSQYNDIPHLLHPVITEANKAVLALNWLVEEMERRYEDMADWRSRDISSYNEKIHLHNERLSLKKDALGKPKPIMPHIVVLIDELGDLMMVAGKEVESAIIRISQKARAVGIHLILATQRPSVDVITALIKANCPARLALQVAQKTDSRTILDSNGAETLLGRGDFLFKHPSKGQLIRVQAPLVSDEEVEKVVESAKKVSKPCYINLEDSKANSAQLEGEDELLFDEAWEIIVESQKASASYLQRRLRIGYNRAARLIEAFEARGYIGPQVGSKPREILPR